MVQLQLNLSSCELRFGGILEFAETRSLGNDALIEPETEAGVFKIDALGPETVEERLFQKAWQAHLIHVNQQPDEPQHKQKHGNPEPPEIHPHCLPEASALFLPGHRLPHQGPPRGAGR